MKRIVIIIIIFLNILGLKAQNKGDAIIGEWYMSEQRNSKCQIYKQGNKYVGKVVWLKEPAKDKLNPKREFQDRDVVGILMLTNFVFNGKDKWEDGKIYDPWSGKTYSCTIKLRDESTMEVRGYIGFSMLGRTVEWMRVLN